MVAAAKVSEKKLQANRRNARKSTGPRTLEGKASSSQNARTHGAFCQYVVLETEDATEFNLIRREFIQRLRPQDRLELSFVERVAEGTWRLMRLNRQEWEQEKRIREFECTDEWHGPWAPEGARDLGPARQRVEQSISRALRELRALQSPNKAADLPPSPYLQDEAEEEDENPQNEPTACESPATADPADTSVGSAVRTSSIPASPEPTVGMADPTGSPPGDPEPGRL
jgi:hypothetical protein